MGKKDARLGNPGIGYQPSPADYKRLVRDEQLPASHLLIMLVLAPMEVFPGITMIPEVCAGKPCIADTSVDVATLVGALGIGQSFADVQEAYQVSYEQSPH